MTREQRLEVAKIRARAWRAANREKHRTYQRQYRLDHKEECYEKNRRWAKGNPELVREYHRRSRNRTPSTYKASHQKYWAKNPDMRRLACANRRARKVTNGGSISESQWQEVKRKYDFRCLRCGKKKPLTLDHVVPISKGGCHEVSNIQPLCLECNSSKSTKDTDYRPLLTQPTLAL